MASTTIKNVTTSSATVLSVHILAKSSGAVVVKPLHLQVQEVSVPALVLSARCDVMVEAYAVAKMDMKRARKESGVERMLRRRSLELG